jgi:carbon-monoxide dehydrogenase large subunit
MGQFGIGQPVPREEDPYLLRGAGRYVDDVRLLDLARAVFLRSPHPHARIRKVDVEAAKAAPGVLLVLTGESPEVAALGLQVPRMPRKRRIWRAAPSAISASKSPVSSPRRSTRQRTRRS